MKKQHIVVLALSLMVLITIGWFIFLVFKLGNIWGTIVFVISALLVFGVGFTAIINLFTIAFTVVSAFGETGKSTRRTPTQEMKHDVFRRDGGRCQICGSTYDLQYDHILPFSRGGKTTVNNLQLLCKKCNLEKSDK